MNTFLKSLRFTKLVRRLSKQDRAQMKMIMLRKQMYELERCRFNGGKYKGAGLN
jgi:hypothetical protein